MIPQTPKGRKVNVNFILKYNFITLLNVLTGTAWFWNLSENTVKVNMDIPIKSACAHTRC